MKNFCDINLGYNDAASYNSSVRNRRMLSSIFIKDEKLERLLQDDTYYLVGEKGTGKTAYASYLQNTAISNIKAVVVNIKETDFLIFMSLRKKHLLELSSYEKIWNIMIMLIAANLISKEDIATMGPNRSKALREIKQAIDEYYKNAFIPEIPSMIKYVLEESSSFDAGFKSEILQLFSAQASGDKCVNVQKTSNLQVFQNNLTDLENRFKQVFVKLKINKSIFVIIDNVDISLTDFGAEEYEDCLRGLIDAIWTTNTSVFARMGDSDYFIKAIVSIRPDVFASINTHNFSNKIQDNSVVLDWRTTYDNYRNSSLFKLCCRLLAYDNPGINEEAAWDYYFPWSKPSSNEITRTQDDSFIVALRYSLCRPRDLISIMKAMQQTCKTGHKAITTITDFESYVTQNEISNYYIAEARDWCMYKISSGGFDSLMYFFQFLNGKSKFSYIEYQKAFGLYTQRIDEHKLASVQKDLDEKSFLQLLYDLNMIGYYDQPDEQFVRYCYRERELYNLNPQVKLETNYVIHRALLKALNLGR